MRKEFNSQNITRGDEEALRELIEQYYPEILRYCRWHASSKESAEDAAQESFLKAIHFISRNQFRGNFRAFLYQIARNTCLDMKKASWNSVDHYEDLLVEPSEDDQTHSRIELQADIRNAMKILNDEEREIILLRFGQELTLREIGKILGQPLRTVQSKMRKALSKMKPYLEDVKQ